ncbi:unnamed protein product [Alternaria alternata]
MAFSLDRSNTIGFIGLGAMGHHMVEPLTAPDHRPGSGEVGYALCDVDQAAVDKIVKHHASEHPNTPLVSCSSPYDVAQKASVIISMVPTGRHVQEVYVGESKSVLSALESMSQEERAATLCVDQSTIEQKVSKTVALRLREAGADLVDAPVSGGVIGAEKGTLAIMVGGSKSSFDRAVPVLESMSRKVTYCGDLGAGLAAKIANKYVEFFTHDNRCIHWTADCCLYSLLLGITMLGLSEAMLLGKRLGVDSQVLADIINNSTGRCWSSEINHPVPNVKVSGSSPPAHRNYEGGFVTKLAHKDLALAMYLLLWADALKRPIELLANSEEFGNRDFSVIYEALDAMGSSAGNPKL